MLRLTIELLPDGDESKAKVIASGTVEPIGAGTGSKAHVTGNYRYKLKNKRKIWKEGRLMGFPRKGHGVWALLYSILWLELDNKSGIKK